MEVIVRDVADLFGSSESARDSTGSLRAIGKLLKACDPDLLLLADHRGNVVVAEAMQSPADLSEADSLAGDFRERLVDAETCLFEVSGGLQPRLAFAVRLSGEADGGFLGGVVGRCETFQRQFGSLAPAIAACGALAWSVVRSGFGEARSATRIKHLLAEQDTLRASHSQAISSAIEEREERLRQQREHVTQLRTVMMMAADGIVTTDETGMIESFNEAAGSIFGYASEEVIGKNVSMLIPTPRSERGGEYLARHVRTNAQEAHPSAREVTGQRKDGTLFPLELAVSEVALGSRRIFTGILRDITRRKTEEAELRRLHLQNETILNTAGEGIFGLSRDGKAVFINPAGASMLGCEPEDVIGKTHHELFHHSKLNGQPYPPDECPIRKTLCDGTVPRVDSEVFWRSDGTSFPVEYTSTPIREGDEIVGAVVTFQDITRRRALEAQLAQAQKLESIGQLAAGIAHEINTPTQYIGDNARFLEGSFQDLEELLEAFQRLLCAGKNHAVTDELLGEVQAAVERADLDYLTEEMPKAIAQSLEGVHRVATIVRSMKEFSHPGGAQKQAMDVNRAMENTLTVSHNEWKYVARAETDFDPNLPLVACLPGECNQVFLNLIINAAHAIADKLGPNSTEKGTIGITTRREGDWVEIRVKDSGTGIPENIRSKVLDPFFTTKEVGRGTGQGLAIAHAVVVEKHGGTLAFDTQIGRGTTFIVRLPIHAGAA